MNLLLSSLLLGNIGFHDIESQGIQGIQTFNVDAEFNYHLEGAIGATIYSASVNGVTAQDVEWSDEPGNILTLTMPNGDEIAYGANGPLMWLNGTLITVNQNSYAEWDSGDSNLDGIFSSSDFVTAFQCGNYRDDIAEMALEAFECGDWNGDGDFSTSDIVHAFTWTPYEQNPVKAVPEPSAVCLIFLGLICLRCP